MEDFNLIYVPLKADQKKIALGILNEINDLLRKWHKKLPKIKFRDLRKMVFNGDKSSVPDELHDEFLTDAVKIAQLRQPVAELDNRTIEQAIMEGYAGWATHIAMSFFHKTKPQGMDVEDLLQESYLNLFEAMYRFDQDRGALSSLLHQSIKRHLTYEVNQQGRALSHLSEDSIELYVRFIKTSKENPSLTNDGDVIKKMNLSGQEELHLIQTLSSMSVAWASDIIAPNSTRSDAVDDYTALSRRESVFTASETNAVLHKMHIQEILENSNLNEAEKKVMTQVLTEPYTGMLVDMAKTLFNKPVSKQRIGQILEKARDKVADYLNRNGIK